VRLGASTPVFEVFATFIEVPRQPEAFVSVLWSDSPVDAGESTMA